MRFLFTIGLTIFLSTTVFGTVQIPDKIIYKGKEYRLGYSYPLESYFEKYPKKRPEDGDGCTALNRGYVATFEIIDNQLFLKNIEIEVRDTINKYNTNWKSVLNEVFPNQELVKIDWLTELLILPYGEYVHYVYMEYGYLFRRSILLEIDKGVLKKEKQIPYKKYKKKKEKQFQAFKKTEEYEKMKADVKKENNYDDELIDSFLRSFVIEHILIKDDKKQKLRGD